MEVDDKLRGLTLLGYKGGGVFNPKEFDMNRIEAIRGIIRYGLEKRKTINHDIGTSYGLKHRVEEHSMAMGEPLNGYVSNGECIYAMILEGYEVYRCGVNAKFNVTTKSFDSLYGKNN